MEKPNGGLGRHFFSAAPEKGGSPDDAPWAYVREGPFRTDIYATLPVLAEIFALFCRI